MVTELSIPDMTTALRSLIAQIPPGRVATCGALAEALGNRVAALWVARFLMHHEHDARCPCHHVIRAEGRLGGYIGGTDREKIERLAAESIEVREGMVDLPKYGFADFEGDRPLEQLRRVQEQVAGLVTFRSWPDLPPALGGVDVAYPKPDEGVAAYAAIDTRSGELIWSHTIRRRAAFPYISTYLTFRELPILLDLVDEVRAAGRLAPVLLVDGTGILHPRRIGNASHFGVAAGVPTVGVTKKLLCGQVSITEMTPLESRPVVQEGETIGMALRPTSGSRRPIFISPGTGVDLPSAERMVRAMLRGHRLPEPVYWADRLSKRKDEG